MRVIPTCLNFRRTIVGSTAKLEAEFAFLGRPRPPPKPSPALPRPGHRLALHKGSRESTPLYLNRLDEVARTSTISIVKLPPPYDGFRSSRDAASYGEWAGVNSGWFRSCHAGLHSSRSRPFYSCPGSKLVTRTSKGMGDYARYLNDPTKANSVTVGVFSQWVWQCQHSRPE